MEGIYIGNKPLAERLFIGEIICRREEFEGFFGS
jgi:hypothetical protein